MRLDQAFNRPARAFREQRITAALDDEYRWRSCAIQGALSNQTDGDEQVKANDSHPPEFIHPTAVVASAEIGEGTRVQEYAVIRDGVRIGDRCLVDSHCTLNQGVVMGDRVSISEGVHLAAGVRIGDDVSIGPNSVIGSDRASARKDTMIRDGATLGANVTVAPGVDIGQFSCIEAGSVVTANVPPGATVVGNPAVMQLNPTPAVDQPRTHQTQQSAMNGVQFLSLREIQDVRGTLTVCQWNQHLPFVPRRIFFLHGVPDKNVRGAHAHKECVQALVCFNGSVNVLLDDGQHREEFVLDSSQTALIIPAGIWATQFHYSAHAILAVFASHDYDAADYIRNYDDFLSYRRRGVDIAA